MNEHETKLEKVPNPKEIEREIGEFLAKKFGGEVKIINPSALQNALPVEKGSPPGGKKKRIAFDLKPGELVDFLDQYIIRQEEAKAILATKICTHFNRIKRSDEAPEAAEPLVGRIKNNVLMIGPTGVGKTYMIKLIAKRLGVPFVKGDATKFSETGYVGGDVEDLVRDLVREADDDIELAENGIIYIDEIDKIASSRNTIGADVSRTGVQRALLKPMEETDVEMKAAHDPISMIQEIEQFRKTGQRERRTVNTKNILFIMSGAFGGLDEIVEKRMARRSIGFGARVERPGSISDVMKEVRSEDLIEYGFESEFVGRLPVVAVFETLSEADLLSILKNPNNPVILSKRLDFDAYGIDIQFADEALALLAGRAFRENTGARGLVSAIEKGLLPFERSLPSGRLTKLPVTESMIRRPAEALRELDEGAVEGEPVADLHHRLREAEMAHIRDYITAERNTLSRKHGLSLRPPHIEAIAEYYTTHVLDVGGAVRKIKDYFDEIKKIELFFYKNHDINIVMEEDAVHHILTLRMRDRLTIDDIYGQLTRSLEDGLKLVREKTGINRFFITKDAMLSPDAYIANLLKDSDAISLKGDEAQEDTPQ